MITKDQIVRTEGKYALKHYIEKFKNHEPQGHEIKRLQLKKSSMVKHKKCHHGVWVIENYEPKVCSKCLVEGQEHYEKRSKKYGHVHIVPEGEPYFNLATGVVGTDKEQDTYAKARGMERA